MSSESQSSPSFAEIAALAHQYYLEEGCPEGRAEAHWLRAEAWLKAKAAKASITPASSPEPALHLRKITHPSSFRRPKTRPRRRRTGALKRVRKISL
jgi:hypothetical protein